MSIDLNKVLENIADYFDSDAYKQSIVVKNHQYDRINRYFDYIPDIKFDQLVDRFLLWEKKYEEMYYKRNIETNSKIFSILMNIIQKDPDTIILDEQDDFLSISFKYKQYTFKLYSGQGCFWRILRDNEQIFQSS